MFSEMLEINKDGLSFGTASNVYQVYDKYSDKDIFESVIDGLILEKYADDELKVYIKDLPKNKKRIATLSLIGEDHLLWSKINDLLKENKSSYQRLKSVYDILKEYVRIADVERKKHGEILTPFKELAEPMVKLVEKYDAEFWKNKNHKVLDSSAGYGTFLILAAYKFMVGLKDVIEDEEERFKWIVENCLYYGELQAKSVFSWLVAIDPHDEYKTNIYWGSFLTKDFDEHCKNVWCVEKWNLIIQNPPYQMKTDVIRVKFREDSSKEKTVPIWHKFVEKTLYLLSDDGYMVMVHPSGWRNVDGIYKSTQKLMMSNQILELSIHNEKEGIKLFGADTRFDFYILKKCKPYTKTYINSQNDEEEIVDISNMEFIPNGMFKDVYNLICDESNVSILHSYSAYEHRKSFISKEKTNDNIHKVIYTVAKSDKPSLLYSKINTNGHFGVPKLIWSNGRITSVGSLIDVNGEYGMSEFSYAIVDSPENLENIKKAFDSPKFRSLMEMCSVGDMSINRKVISLFKKDFWKEFI